MPISPDAVTELLSALVQINSVNPAFDKGDTDEREIARRVVAEFEASGLEIQVLASVDERPSVVGVLKGTGGGKSLMLYAHIDTVGIEGMAGPLSGEVRDGRLYGRGSYDMKGGLAACIAAARILAGEERLAGDIVVAAVSDEETESIGMLEVLRHITTDGAIVTEPTELEVCLAHKGFAWIEVETHGRAAHGSRFDLGIDANIRMGRVLYELEILERALRASAPHPLVGPPSLHVGRIEGGSGASIYAAKCRLEIERRTVPGESAEHAFAEVNGILDRLRKEDETFEATARIVLAREPFQVAREAPIVQAVAGATSSVLKAEPAFGGQTPWMDAALLADAGVETVVIGPSGVGAHAAEEWVNVASVVKLAEVLVEAAREYCGERGPSAERLTGIGTDP